MLRAIEQGRVRGLLGRCIRQQAAESLQERGMQLMRKAQWCQIIGSVAPMVGLFGTVYGMIRAFNLLGQGTEGPRYEMLAESISMALVTTFWGLLVAIPALFLYGVFQTRIESAVAEAAMELDMLVGRLFERVIIPAAAQAEGLAVVPEAAGEKETETAGAKLVRQGTFLRRKQRRMGVVVQRSVVKRRAEDQ
jgi:flagellar motor component MotA